MTVNEAIDQSISHNEIVHMDWTAERAAHLQHLSDGDVRTFPTHEYWGDRDMDDGMDWRVHLNILPAVEALRDEAGAAGDNEMYDICCAVLDGTTQVGDRRKVLLALDAAAAAIDLDATSAVQ